MRSYLRHVIALVLLLAGAAAPTLRAQAPQPAALTEFTIFIYESPADLARRTDPARAAEYWGAYNTFAKQLADAGALRGGSALAESDAVTVRGSGGADAAVRGARLGGYFVIAARDRAEALQLARRAPAFALAVEVRPHRPNPTMADAAMARP